MTNPYGMEWPAPMSAPYSSPRPSPLAVWRHCPNDTCAVSWFSVDAACWVCGLTGASGQLTNPACRPFEAYLGLANENHLTA